MSGTQLAVTQKVKTDQPQLVGVTGKELPPHDQQMRICRRDSTAAELVELGNRFRQKTRENII